MHDTSALSASLAAAMVRQIETLLLAALADPDRSIGAYSLVTAQDRSLVADPTSSLAFAARPTAVSCRVTPQTTKAVTGRLEISDKVLS